MMSRSLRACRLPALGAAALVLTALPARADGVLDGVDDDTEAAPPEPGRFGHAAPEHEHRLAIGAGFLLGLTSLGEGAIDITDEGDAHSDPQLSVAFGSQLTPTWVVGLRMAYAAKPFYSDVPYHALWQLTAEARWQPEGELGPYAVAGAGGVAAVDDSGGVSAWRLAPAVGGALGFDVALSRPVTLGFELRAMGAVFRDERESFGGAPSEPSIEYGLSSWLGLNVIATLGIAERESASVR
jgi:hypothetical protein